MAPTLAPPAGQAAARRRAPVALTAAALVGLYLTLTLSTAWQKSAHFDEAAHLGAGAWYLEHGDFRVGTANLVLGQTLAALPLRTDAVRPLDEGLRRTLFGMGVPDAFALGSAWLYRSGNDAQALLWRGRVVMALLGALAALAVFLWSRQIFGGWGGVVSLLFLATCPTFVSLGGIVGADMPVACAFIWTTWAFWTLLHRATPWTVVAFALGAGLLLLTKLSGLAFGPIALALLGLRLACRRPLPVGWGWRPRAVVSSRAGIAAILGGALAASAALAWGVVWLGYHGRFAAGPAGVGELGAGWASIGPTTGPVAAFVEWARAGHLLPEAWLADLARVARIAQARSAFFLGDLGTTGWALYFPFTLVAKSNPFLLAALAGAGGWAALVRPWRSASSPPGATGAGAAGPFWYPLAPMVVAVAVYLAIAMASTVNIGHRHVLPVYPFLFVLAGGLVGPLRHRAWAARAGGGLLLVGALATAATFHPDPLAYLSPLVGAGQRPYRLLVDSSLEWGQELPALGRWLAALPERATTPTYLSYFGTGVPERHGIRARPLPSCYAWAPPLRERLRPGTYLVSGTMLQPIYYQAGDVSMAGPWSEEHERVYRLLRPYAEAYYDAAEAAGEADGGEALRAWMVEHRPPFDPGTDALELWAGMLSVYDLARFARLARYLREGPAPDEAIAGSVFVFRLGDAQLREALD